MNKPKEIYMVWETDGDCGYFLQYDSLKDAVCSHGDKTEVYFAKPQFLGTYEKSVKIVKSKKKAG